MLETKIEAAFVAATAKLGGWALKFTSPGTTGVPDRAALLPCGCTWYAELKRPKDGRLSARQRLVHARMAKLRHQVAVLWTLDAVAEWARHAREHIAACTTPRALVKLFLPRPS